jgi:hypothetical protein
MSHNHEKQAVPATDLDDELAAILEANEAGVATAMHVFEAAESSYYEGVAASVDMTLPLVESSTTS